MVQHIISSRSWNLFLIEEKGIHYLVNILEGVGLQDDICPCCLTIEERESIRSFIEKAVASGKVSQKVVWCGGGYGERMETGDLKDTYSHFPSEDYTWNKQSFYAISNEKRQEALDMWWMLRNTK